MRTHFLAQSVSVSANDDAISLSLEYCPLRSLLKKKVDESEKDVSIFQKTLYHVTRKGWKSLCQAHARYLLTQKTQSVVISESKRLVFVSILTSNDEISMGCLNSWSEHDLNLKKWFFGHKIFFSGQISKKNIRKGLEK